MEQESSAGCGHLGAAAEPYVEEHEDDDFAHEGRPDAAVVDHLFRARVIDTAQYQELRRDGRLSERPVMNTASRREEHRRRR